MNSDLLDLPSVADEIERLEELDKTSVEAVSRPSGIVLSQEQAEALERVQKWLVEPGNLEYRLGGYAGTGKTTLLKVLVDTLGYSMPLAIASFTGKAVAVLRRKGLFQAQTLHRLLYKVRNVGGKTVFEPVTYLWANLIIVDEASMVSTALYNDLKRHGKKMLFVGDPAQLEPVGDNPNLMKAPDFTLTQIHRQAEESPIIVFSQKIRNGEQIKCGYWESPDASSTLLVTNDPGDMEYQSFDVMICAKNNTRHNLNQRYRFEHGYEVPLRPGEQIICLKNHKDSGLFNGMILTVVNIKEGELKGEPVFYCDLIDDLAQVYPQVPVSKEWFGKNYENQIGMRRKDLAFDYSYCITAHKSQGSEFDNVGVYHEDLFKCDMRRWAYTACTRASDNLVYLI